MNSHSVKFHTNIDCMKIFMRGISGLSIYLNVGDVVEVYKDSEIIVELQVVQRSWTFVNGPVLHCFLDIPPNRWESLQHFIETMKTYNIG